MVTIARGAEQVRKVELALGGKPPERGAAQSLAALKRQAEDRIEQRRAQQAIIRPLMEKVQAPLRALMATADKASIEALKQHQEQLSRLARKRPVDRRPIFPDVPQMGIEPGFLLKVPAYDEAFQYASSAQDVASTTANKDLGAYQLHAAGYAGSNASAAGIGVWFFAYEDNPMQRVAALVDYAYNWGTMSVWGVTAHNDGATNIWVWGFSENGWVAQQGSLSPLLERRHGLVRVARERRRSASLAIRPRVDRDSFPGGRQQFLSRMGLVGGLL